MGLNHSSAPVSLRERLAFPATALEGTLTHLQSNFADSPALLSEVALISTCNRTELYCATTKDGATQERLTHWLSQVSSVRERELAQHLYK
ncbi:MAG: glutamyl-tRNA reductase, partial [Burkholderiaceae bacterium]